MAIEKRRHSTAQSDLTVEHRRVQMDGRSVGLAASLGNSFLFYTTDDRLQDLDGLRFDSMKNLQAAVEAAIRESSEPGIAA